jgi:succinate dehydrogenase / fumarate reductase flavoprotein subunit
MSNAMTLDPRIPSGSIGEKWTRRQSELRLVHPANRGRYRVVVVGTGLAGASAAAALGELGYRVTALCLHDSPRRAHSVAAQGGLNAAKNYRNDGDSVYRLFLDTLKGGDYRSREANVYRLAELGNRVVDHCVAQGVPFTREYGGFLDNRSFGGSQVSRTFYAQGQTGQQLLLAAYGALMKEVSAGTVEVQSRREMVDLIVVDGRARGVIVRNLVTGRLKAYVADAVVLATGGYSNVYYLSTNGKASNASAVWRAHRRGAFFANPCFTQIHPTCLPQNGQYQSKLTLMSESLRNDGRIWVPMNARDRRHPNDIPEAQRDYYLERKYPGYGNLVPRDVASRSAKEQCDRGKGVGPTGTAVYLDFRDALKRLGADVLYARYGNLFRLYREITDSDPCAEPMRIYPAVHYTMGGLWVDYHLMSNLPGLFVVGEANFSDHGANRLGANALLQGLVDGYFILPATLPDYLATAELAPVDAEHPAVAAAEADAAQRIERLLNARGRRPADEFHHELGKLLWDACGMTRNATGLQAALERIPELREEFWSEVSVPGRGDDLNVSLEKAGRIADYFELAELMVRDALFREESCGSHFREEHQTAEGEPLRNDRDFACVAAWEFREGGAPVLHREELAFREAPLEQRVYR